MDALPDFLRFTPVSTRARHDGWTEAAQRRFILSLARGLGPSAAARREGKSRQTAYALRAKPGAESFAAAWDAAQDFARGADVALEAALPGTRDDVMLIPRYYRGRLIGFVQRSDHRALFRTLRALDRVTDRLDTPGNCQS
ncbi:hypothetical protein IC614_06135 [Allosphingosinicella flava]|uniref:Helix-turn-helix domain-containing protein n=1 Tax=Allosphingosinicella flava TaxID=2771430 RepID=A0A7T2LN11_9SPHN|nr:hypothetical protein [Sphingosinicella flava]QPQ56139.1 hypothetical protein IC614_06135 [Sphingosinicella flava]